ncbi:hypothetical protein QOT17_025189, partial [Balamuthia mandrillaris]
MGQRLWLTLALVAVVLGLVAAEFEGIRPDWMVIREDYFSQRTEFDTEAFSAEQRIDLLQQIADSDLSNDIVTLPECTDRRSAGTEFEVKKKTAAQASQVQRSWMEPKAPEVPAQSPKTSFKMKFASKSASSDSNNNRNFYPNALGDARNFWRVSKLVADNQYLEYPYSAIVRVVTVDSDNKVVHCTGSVIGESTVLTSPLCVYGASKPPVILTGFNGQYFQHAFLTSAIHIPLNWDHCEQTTTVFHNTSILDLSFRPSLAEVPVPSPGSWAFLHVAPNKVTFNKEVHTYSQRSGPTPPDLSRYQEGPRKVEPAPEPMPWHQTLLTPDTYSNKLCDEDAAADAHCKVGRRNFPYTDPTCVYDTDADQTPCRDPFAPSFTYDPETQEEAVPSRGYLPIGSVTGTLGLGAVYLPDLATFPGYDHRRNLGRRLNILDANVEAVFGSPQVSFRDDYFNVEADWLARGAPAIVNIGFTFEEDMEPPEQAPFFWAKLRNTVAGVVSLSSKDFSATPEEDVFIGSSGSLFGDDFKEFLFLYCQLGCERFCQIDHACGNNRLDQPLEKAPELEYFPSIF